MEPSSFWTVGNAWLDPHVTATVFSQASSGLLQHLTHNTHACHRSAGVERPESGVVLAQISMSPTQSILQISVANETHHVTVVE
ncbi:hypothetical protein J6590_070758 [Homalodisca vitripennis]|nr:hypothetical protein J6590_070758 [Homalodisca vitripennis]